MDKDSIAQMEAVDNLRALLPSSAGEICHIYRLFGSRMQFHLCLSGCFTYTFLAVRYITYLGIFYKPATKALLTCVKNARIFYKVRCGAVAALCNPIQREGKQSAVSKYSNAVPLPSPDISIHISRSKYL
tara:strand:- start:437 stop:826 length:390 start_codon:yes stop_codon:yes gene_type:complete